MILFTEIFNRAVNLFDDPIIRRAHFEDAVKFSRLMRPFLINGLSMFVNPNGIADNLSLYDDECGQAEVFTGTGVATYTLSTTPVANAVFTCRVQGKPDATAQYNSEDNSVTFTYKVPIDCECTVEWYYPGSFTINPAGGITTNVLSQRFIIERVKDILAHCLVLAWSEKEENNVLEIRNLLTDTDFKLYSPANSIRAKAEWYKQIREGLNDLTNKLTWDLYGRSLGRRIYGK